MFLRGWQRVNGNGSDTQEKTKYAVITRRVVPLSGLELGPVEFGNRDWAREMLEQAFDDGNDDFK